MATFADRLGGYPRWVTEAYWIETRGSILTSPAHPKALRKAMAVARGLIPQVAAQTGSSSQDVEGWLSKLRRGRLAQEIRARCPEATGMGSPNAELLYVFVRALRPRVVVETGVELGVSSAYFLQALQDNGSGDLWSIDLPTVGPAGRVNQDGRLDQSHVGSLDQVGQAVPDRLRPRWHLSLGDAKALLPGFAAPDPWDIFFHDSDHSRDHMFWEYQTAWPRIRPGGFLLSDDVPNNDAFLSFAAAVGGNPFLWLRRGALRKPATPEGVA
jgi:predicted O-methyltransferase YrrM